MQIPTNSLCLETKGLKRIPERPIDQLQPRELRRREDATALASGVQKRHQAGVRPGMAPNDSVGFGEDGGVEEQMLTLGKQIGGKRKGRGGSSAVALRYSVG